MPLKIAVPNKGRLMEETLELLRDVGVRVPRQTDRTLIATTNGGKYQVLFSRAADSDAAWSASRFLPGQESGQARFAEKYTESAPEAGGRQVCQGFAHWSDHARAVRVVVRYSLQV